MMYMYLQKVISIKTSFLLAFGKVNDENSRIRIHKSEEWIRGSRSGSGSTPKCHGSATLEDISNNRKLSQNIPLFSNPYVFGPPGSGSVSHKQGSGSIYHKARVVRFLLFCDFFMTFYLWRMTYIMYQCPDPDTKDPFVFVSTGSASGSVPKCHLSATLLNAIPLRKVLLHRSLYSFFAAR